VFLPAERGLRRWHALERKGEKTHPSNITKDYADKGDETSRGQRRREGCKTEVGRFRLVREKIHCSQEQTCDTSSIVEKKNTRNKGMLAPVF